jgi:hypothetical protein
LGPEVNESPKVILERLFVLLLTQEKVALCKFWTLKTLEIGENPLLQIILFVNHTGTQEGIPLCCRLVCSDDERFHQHRIVTAN